MNAIQDTEELVLALRKLNNRLEDLADKAYEDILLKESDFEDTFEIVEECRAFVGY